MKKLLGIVVLGLLLSNCAPLDTSKWPSSYRTVTAETSDGNTYSYTHVTFLNAFGKNDFNQCKLDSYWYKIASKTFSEKTRYHVPDLAVTDCYSKQEAYKLCLEWDWVYKEYKQDTAKYLRSRISEALIVKKEKPLKCRNSQHDLLVDANREIEKAKSRASAAEIEAENARAVAEIEKRIKEQDND